jgi:cysteamine dioxygenase
MRSLIKSLQHFSKASNEHVELFRKLSLEDLGVYVSDVDAVQYTRNNSYPLEEKVFLLKNALYQCRYDSVAAGFVPQPWKASTADPLGCSTLFEDKVVTLCWFVIPPGRVLPLHDHPGMTVWQRVMHGRLHICTLVSDALPAVTKTSYPTKAKVVFSGEVCGLGEPIPPSELLSFGKGDGGVLHEIRNVDPLKPALFVDIIAPPYYQAPTNISCSYYRAEPLSRSGTTAITGLPTDCGIHSSLKKGDTVLLQPRPEYSGPAMNAYVHVSDV